ncbi:MAG: RNA-binding protein [Candidatus Methylacidiphilales bacterium]|nr:RNA-binding protein [Candidatus Methylacidiphilales bacterium]
MKLYVGNLSFQTTDTELREHFGQHGSVTDVHLVMDRETQRPRGFAFVTMGSPAEGQAAISALDGQPLDGRDLTVNEARPMEPRSGGGGGGGGRRDFGGGDRRGGGGGGGGFRGRR